MVSNHNNSDKAAVINLTPTNQPNITEISRPRHDLYLQRGNIRLADIDYQLLFHITNHRPADYCI